MDAVYIQIRSMLVHFATIFWQGESPLPDAIRTASIRGTLDTFKQFWNRFAPTKELATVLFPRFLLDLHSSEGLQPFEQYLECDLDDFIDWNIHR